MAIPPAASGKTAARKSVCRRSYSQAMKLSLLLPALALTSSISAAKEALWTATPFTAANSFTDGVEGPACDKQGNVYAVNFARQHTIGKITPAGVGEVFVVLNETRIGNGIRFNNQGQMFVADYQDHNILKVDPVTKAVAVFAHEAAMSQPNDIAIAPDGTLFASDPDWPQGTGRVWRISRQGEVTLAAEGIGTANGIEISADGRTLYVDETVQRNIWAFHIEADGKLTGKRLIRQFPDFGFDGMRCDVDGNLYITRNGKGTVIKMTPAGEVLQEIDVLGTSPTNLCFGGPDGCTVYVTEAEKCRLVSFRVDKPGQEWKRGW
ncbi:MAG: gluconolactonase [Verrucomicrobiaceae bacterium]|nr:gluconolactonase [Verrucomicrobiaceae bacterium]